MPGQKRGVAMANDRIIEHFLESLGLEEFVDRFNENRIESQDLPDLTEADLKELGLPLGPRKRILRNLPQRITNEVDRDTYHFLTQLPACIAAPLHKVYLAKTSTGDRLRALVFAYYQFLRLIGLILLTEYARSDYLWPRCVQALKRISYPHVADWRTLIDTLSKSFREAGAETILPSALVHFRSGSHLRRLSYQKCIDNEGCFVELSDPVSILHTLRNHLAHSGIGFEDQLDAEFVDRYLNIFHDLLDLFPEVRQLRILVETPDQPKGSYTIQQGLPPFAQRRGSDTLLGLPVDGGGVLIEHDKGILSLYPLFIPPENPSTVPTAICDIFDGHSEKQVCYFGLGKRRYESNQMKTFNELVGKKLVLAGHELPFLDWSLLEERAALANQHVLCEYYPGKYDPNCYLSRHIPDQVADEFISSSKNSLFLLGDAGIGKSAFVHRFIERHAGQSESRQDQSVAILIPGALLDHRPRETSLIFSLLEEQLGVRRKKYAGFLDIIDCLSAQRPEGARLILVLDALNESSDYVRVLQEADDLISLLHRKQIDWVKVILTARLTFHLLIKPRFYLGTGRKSIFRTPKAFFLVAPSDSLDNDSPALLMKPLSDCERSHCFESMQLSIKKENDFLSWRSLPTNLREILSTPLFIKLFFDAHLKTKSNRPILTESELFTVFFGLMQKESNLLTSFLLKMAERMDEIGSNALGLSAIWSLLPTAKSFVADGVTTLLDPVESAIAEGVLKKSFEDQSAVKITFTHQLLLEFLIFYNYTEQGEISTARACHLLESVAQAKPPTERQGAAILLLSQLILCKSFHLIIGAVRSNPELLVQLAIQALFRTLARTPEAARLAQNETDFQSFLAPFSKLPEEIADYAFAQIAEALFLRGFYNFSLIAIDRLHDHSSWRYLYWLGRCDLERSNYENAERRLREVMRHPEAQSEIRQLSRFFLAQSLHDRGLYQEELNLLSNVDLQDLDPFLQARLLHQRGSAFSRMCRYREANDSYSTSLAIGDSLNLQWACAETRHELAYVCEEAGQFEEAMGHCREVEDVFRRIKHHRSLAYSLFLQGRILGNHGPFDTAQQVLDEGLAIMEAMDERRGQVLIRREIGCLRLAEGNLDRALAEFTPAWTLAKSIGYLRSHFYLTLYLIETHAQLRNLSQLEKLLELSYELCQRVNDPKSEARMHRALGVAHLAKACADDAHESFKRYLAGSESIDYRRGIVYGLLLLLETEKSYGGINSDGNYLNQLNQELLSYRDPIAASRRNRLFL